MTKQKVNQVDVPETTVVAPTQILSAFDVEATKHNIVAALAIANLNREISGLCIQIVEARSEGQDHLYISYRHTKTVKEVVAPTVQHIIKLAAEMYDFIATEYHWR